MKQSGVKYVSEGEEDFVATFMVKTPQLAGPCVVSYYWEGKLEFGSFPSVVTPRKKVS